MKSLFKIENIVGVKDATSNIPRVYESKTVIGENFNQLTGDDATTLAFMTYGGHGSISVTSNIAPKLCSQFMQLCLSKDFAEAAKINDKLMPLHHALFVESSPGPVKYAASKLGLCGEEIRLPLTLISDETKVLVDKDSPFLKSIILNKGTKDKLKIGMAVVDEVYLVGKIIEVNFTNSRALLLSDLNSKIPVVLEPIGMQAVVSGTGSNNGSIQYTKEEYGNDIKNQEIIAYTSGLGGLFKPGIPVGKISKDNIVFGDNLIIFSR